MELKHGGDLSPSNFRWVGEARTHLCREKRQVQVRSMKGAGNPKPISIVMGAGTGTRWGWPRNCKFRSRPHSEPQEEGSGKGNQRPCGTATLHWRWANGFVFFISSKLPGSTGRQHSHFTDVKTDTQGVTAGQWLSWDMNCTKAV